MVGEVEAADCWAAMGLAGVEGREEEGWVVVKRCQVGARQVVAVGWAAEA